MWCHTATSLKCPGTGGSQGQCPVDVNPLPIVIWATAALVQLLMSALMVTEIRWHPVGMAPVLLEATSSFTLWYCMLGKIKKTVTDNKILNGDLSGICPPSPGAGVPGELRVLASLLSSL